MGRQKRKAPRPLEVAKKRLAGIKSINENLDLGNGLSVASYSQKVGEVQSEIDTYNQFLSLLDRMLNNITVKEKSLRDMNERMLEAVGSVYGHDSNEYEMAGGTRKSEIKRSSGSPEQPPA